MQKSFVAIGHIRIEDGLVIGGQLLGLSGLVVVEAQRKIKERFNARMLPLSAFSRKTMRAASCVDFVRVRPFSFTLTGIANVRFTSVLRLRTPLRRPAG